MDIKEEDSSFWLDNPPRHHYAWQIDANYRDYIESRKTEVTPAEYFTTSRRHLMDEGALSCQA
jgi:hypothetical protein